MQATQFSPVQLAFGHTPATPKTVHGVTRVDTHALEKYFLAELASVKHAPHNAEQANVARQLVSKAAGAVFPFFSTIAQGAEALTADYRRLVMDSLDTVLKPQGENALAMKFHQILQMSAIQMDQSFTVAEAAGHISKEAAAASRTALLDQINNLAKSAHDLMPYIDRALEAGGKLLKQLV